MKQITQIKIDSPIVPNQGIGEIKLGMNSYYLRDFYGKNFQDNSGAYSIDFDKNKWKSELWKPFLGSLNLIYKDFLNVTINLFNGSISHLRVKNDYQGKVNGIVGIGDTMRKYYQSNKDIFCEFDEGSFFYWINNRFGLSFYIGDDLEDYQNDELFEKYLDKAILEIEIFDDKQRIGVGADLPENLKIKN